MKPDRDDVIDMTAEALEIWRDAIAEEERRRVAARAHLPPDAMLTEARERGLWFKHKFEQTWRTPDEMEDLVTGMHGGYNEDDYVLRDPRDRLNDLFVRSQVAARERDEFAEKYRTWIASQEKKR